MAGPVSNIASMTDELRNSFDERDPEDLDEKAAAHEERLGIAWGFVLFLLFASLLAVFIVQNTEEIVVEFLWVDVTVSVWIVIMVAVLLTLVFDQLISMSWRRRRRRDIRRKREEPREEI